jgi:hypothetical protein
MNSKYNYDEGYLKLINKIPQLKNDFSKQTLQDIFNKIMYVQLTLAVQIMYVQ